MSVQFEPPWLEHLKKLKQDGKLFISVSEAAKLLGVSETTIRRAVRGCLVDAIKVRGAWMIYIDSFIEFSKQRYNLNILD